MKIFKHRNMMGLIYSFILAIPLLAVLARSAYVIVNKNAYQNNGITQEVYERQNIEGLYTFHYDNSEDYDLNSYLSEETKTVELEGTIYSISDFTTNEHYIDEFYYENNFINFNNCTFSYYANYNDNSHLIIYIGGNTDYISIYLDGINSFYMDISINLSSGDATIQNLLDNTFLVNCEREYYTYVAEEVSTLDNVFEYSLDKVIEGNNFGNINFLQWFSSMFLNDNAVNNRYVNYVNWYLNYVMFMSCAYLLFLVLMWFINFSRRLLERGMNYDW